MQVRAEAVVDANAIRERAQDERVPVGRDLVVGPTPVRDEVVQECAIERARLLESEEATPPVLDNLLLSAIDPSWALSSKLRRGLALAGTRRRGRGLRRLNTGSIVKERAWTRIENGHAGHNTMFLAGGRHGRR